SSPVPAIRCCRTPTARALDRLDFMLAIDIYLNETTRHADLILPPTWSLERDNYDLFFYVWAVRNVAKYSPAALPKPVDSLHPWEILLDLSGTLLGMQGADAKTVDDALLGGLVDAFVGHPETTTQGVTRGQALALLGDRPGPDRMIDLLLRIGPYGDAFGRRPEGLDLVRVRGAEHGIDFGP